MASKQPILRMEQIDKWFSGVHELDHVDFDLYEGEVHVLLGENGAGKSTLMKILSGSLPPDSGRSFVQGKLVTDLTRETARAMGIGMVCQELSLVPNLAVAENIHKGRRPGTQLGLVDWRSVSQGAAEHLKLLQMSIDPDVLVRSLDVAEQQLTEIARVLGKQPSILLLDELTSALSDMEHERLFEIIRRSRERGVAIVYVSHRPAEVPQIAQRGTVLRDGRRIATTRTEEVTEERLIQMMVGRQLIRRRGWCGGHAGGCPDHGGPRQRPQPPQRKSCLAACDPGHSDHLGGRVRPVATPALRRLSAPGRFGDAICHQQLDLRTGAAA